MPRRNASSPRNCSSMRSTDAPFSYVTASNIPSASAAVRTFELLGRVEESASTPNGACLSRTNSVQERQSGRQSSTILQASHVDDWRPDWRSWTEFVRDKQAPFGVD